MLEFLTESDVPDSVKDVVEVIGMDAFKDLVKLAGGSNLYIPNDMLEKCPCVLVYVLVYVYICQCMYELMGFGEKYSINYDYDRLENIVKHINSIRSTLGHNLDERNGTDERLEGRTFLRTMV